jgi:serine/threonine protein kinase
MFRRLYETFDEGTEFYIITELVAGGELFDRIVAKTHYTEKEARDLVKLFLETMAYMHGIGVVHRDLKPENLLLCSGKIRVCVHKIGTVEYILPPIYVYVYVAPKIRMTPTSRLQTSALQNEW